MTDVDGLNAGFARDLLEDYLENPEAVPSEWRELFESGNSDVVATHPGLARLLERAGNGHQAPAAEPPAPAPARTEAPPVTDELLGAVAAAMALVKAHRMHGHLAARLDPLGSEPPGDPALEPERLIPKLTPELQARVPASVLRLYVPGETLADTLPRLRETYCGTIAYELEHIADHEKRVWLRQAIESGKYRHPLTNEERIVYRDRCSARPPSGELTVTSTGNVPEARDSTSNCVVVFPGGSTTIRVDPSGNSSFWLVSSIRTRTRCSVEFSMLSGTDARREVRRKVRLGGAMILSVTDATLVRTVARRA